MAPVFNDTMYDYYYDDKDNMIYPGLKSEKKVQIKERKNILNFFFFREINFTKNFVKLISRKNCILFPILAYCVNIVMALAFVVFSLFFCIVLVFYAFRHEIQDLNISESWKTPIMTKKQLLLMRRRVTLKALNKNKNKSNFMH